MNKLLIGLCCCIAWTVELSAALKPGDVSVKTVYSPAGAGDLETSVDVTAGATPGETVLTVAFTNAGSESVSLEKLHVTLPWVAMDTEGLLLSAGGTEMGDLGPKVLAPTSRGIKSGTYLLAHHPGGDALIGLTTWKTFWTSLHYVDGNVEIEAAGEGRSLAPGATVALDRIVLAEGANWQDLLFRYADDIAKENHVTLRKRPGWIGWGTWDYYGRGFTREAVVENMNRLLEIEPKANLVQIDGGWWPFRGDYTKVRASLPGDPGENGMKTLARLIRAKGLTAGIHLDGMRGDLNSEVAKAHPDYFLKDQDGKILAQPQLNDGDQLIHIFFDFSNPAARDYMKNVLAEIRRDWGYSYFKIDFLRYGDEANILKIIRRADPTRKIVPFDHSLTSLERSQLAMAAFREGMGDDAYFLGCSAPFGLVFGHCDALRTGMDIFPEYTMFRRLGVEDGGNFYLNGRAVWNDADYHIARGGEDEDETLVHNRRKTARDLSYNETEMWTHYVALFGGPVINSDKLPILRDERVALFKLAASLPTSDEFVPIDFWQHARTDQDPAQVFLGHAGDTIYLGIFNWGDRARDYLLTGLTTDLEKLGGSAKVVKANAGTLIHLDSRHSSIFRLKDTSDFDQLRRSLSVE